jgi:hypothetical protein
MSNQKLNRCNTKAFRENPLICAVQTTIMKSRLIVLFCIFFLALGCSKDNNTTKPTIKVISYSSQVRPGESFEAKLSFSQSSGNISGDTLVILYHRLNQSVVPPDDLRPDADTTFMPETPGSDKAEFTASLLWDYISYGINNENDTVEFGFVLIDLNGNRSDTVKTGKVIVLQQ